MGVRPCSRWIPVIPTGPTAPDDAAIDIEDRTALVTYLETWDVVAPGEVRAATPLRGGVSNKVMLVTVDGAPDLVVKQGIARLRVEADWFADPDRVHQEAVALRWLTTVMPDVVPQLRFEDRDNHVLVMTAVDRPHRNWKDQLLDGEVDQGMVTAFAVTLARLHSAGLRRNVPDEFHHLENFRALRERPYYRHTADCVPASRAFLLALLRDMGRVTPTVVHGDYSPKNVLNRHGRLVLLDHEVMHIGDPGFDLGFALTHLLSKAHHLATHRVAFLDACQTFWATYRDVADPRLTSSDRERQTVGHLSACLLARIDGKSPLEYLDASERDTQRNAALALMSSTPATVGDAVHLFEQAVS